MWAPQGRRGVSERPPCQLVSPVSPASRRKARQYWTQCIVEVVDFQPIQVSTTDDYDPGDKQHYQSTIRPVTGRKHQVLAQLSSLGFPIIQETICGPMSGLTMESIGQGDEDEGKSFMDKAMAQCHIPSKPIGLHAHAIPFGSSSPRQDRFGGRLPNPRRRLHFPYYNGTQNRRIQSKPLFIQKVTSKYGVPLINVYVMRGILLGRKYCRW